MGIGWTVNGKRHVCPTIACQFAPNLFIGLGPFSFLENRMQDEDPCPLWVFFLGAGRKSSETIRYLTLPYFETSLREEVVVACCKRRL